MLVIRTCEKEWMERRLSGSRGGAQGNRWLVDAAAL